MIRIFIFALLSFVSISTWATDYKDQNYSFSYDSKWKLQKTTFGVTLKNDKKALIAISPAATADIKEEDAKKVLSIFFEDLDIKGTGIYKKKMGHHSDLTRYEWQGTNKKFGAYYAFWVSLPIKGAKQLEGDSPMTTAIHIAGVIANTPDQMTALEKFENSFNAWPTSLANHKTWHNYFLSYEAVMKLSMDQRVQYITELRKIVRELSEAQNKDPHFKYETVYNGRSLFDFVNVDFFSIAEADAPPAPVQQICVFAGNPSTFSGGKCRFPSDRICKTSDGRTGIRCNPVVFGASSGNKDFCVDAYNGATMSSSTKNCFEASKSLSPEDIAKQFKGKESSYKDLAMKIYSYCSNEGKKNKQAAVCTGLLKRLQAIAEKMGIKLDQEAAMAVANSPVNMCPSQDQEFMTGNTPTRINVSPVSDLTRPMSLDSFLATLNPSVEERVGSVWSVNPLRTQVAVKAWNSQQRDAFKLEHSTPDWLRNDMWLNPTLSISAGAAHSNGLLNTMDFESLLQVRDKRVGPVLRDEVRSATALDLGCVSSRSSFALNLKNQIIEGAGTGSPSETGATPHGAIEENN